MKRAFLRYRSCIAICLISCAILSLFSGCGALPSKRTELWIVTEQGTWDRMNGQLDAVKKAYEEAHDVTIRVDILPTNAQERDARLQQLRTEILQGGGPDAYLLPTDNTLILDEPSQYTYADIEPLFPDVDLAMRNGLFADITRFYDADDDLDKDSLNETILDAGVVNGARYVLPLRYDIPVICAQTDALKKAGLDPAVLTQDICAIMEAVYETGDPLMAGGVLCADYGAFSDFIDYRTGNAKLDAETLARFMADYQKLKALLGSDYLDVRGFDAEERLASAQEDTFLLEKLDIRKFIYAEYWEENAKANTYSWEKRSVKARWTYYPLWIGSLQDTFDYVPLSKFEDSGLLVAPLHTVGGGDVAATVRYYAAVGSGCADPALAYDFLRQFLTEECQWEYNRPVREHPKPVRGIADNTSNDLQYPGLIENGWPVRDKNAVETLWNVRKKQIYIRMADGARRNRMRGIGLMSLTEEDVPLFDTPIGQVRFNTTMSDELAAALMELNDPGTNAPTEADVGALAEKLVWDLRWHVSEG